MQYPLTEKIGNPDLLVGREKEFRQFDKWLSLIPDRLSKSKAILARRKSGKTAFVQRIFNRLWSDNGAVIPFYFDIADRGVWYPDFAVDYYRTFASQYISFIERDEELVNKLLSLDKIREYGLKNSNKLLVDDIDSLLIDKERGFHDSMWKTAYSAPHRFAASLNTRFLVILDEFQNITQYIYRDQNCSGKPDETLAGSFHSYSHSYSESKIAPMLVTGSYVGWLLKVIHQYLEAGRLKPMRLSPYLTQEEGLQAVYKYAQIYKEPITNETAVQINELCLSDPFFISCVIQSDYEDINLTTKEGVINTVNYEITDETAEMSLNWGEYIEKTVKRVNDRHAKNILLHLSQHASRYWTPQEIKDELHIELDVNKIQEKLLIMSEADVIDRGVSNIQFKGLSDGTLNLILRNRFEEEIKGFMPDLKQDFRTQIEALKTNEREIQGMLNQLSGKLAEHQLAAAFLIRKFREVDDRRAAILSVQDKSWTPSQSTNEKKTCKTCNIP
ncbi:hypothetical protein PN36_07235 [Candidatus Thiomargarita nelsonii]|uniref:ATPase domain protein, prokaryote domain protein n=1 Tax=Candidatus Thiomargarita nelsonii TaxID=1003181 RepID=A0A4E0R4D5_9GAMM|nr:hypothetical protein PN36_07235 [Candidatus Thiomargarita nelsonii]